MIFPVRYPSGLNRTQYERSPNILLETDLAEADELPEQVRLAADSTALASLKIWRSGELPRECDGVITWLAGERLLEGSAAGIRQDLRLPGRRCMVPVHYPCLPVLDLLTIQPRWQSAAPVEDFFTPHARIAGAAPVSDAAMTALKSIRRPWSQLLQAVLDELATPGAGLEALARISNDKDQPRVFAALALRNLVVLLMHHKDLRQAEALLQLGRKAYPDYAELSYVGAILCFYQNHPSQAFPFLERAKSVSRELVGSGSQVVRALWLQGVLAAQVGNQRVAFEHFLPGMTSRPVFVPAVEYLLNLRLAPALVEKHQWDFCRLVRREPRWLDQVFDYLLLHRAFDAARRIVETVTVTDEKRTALREKLTSMQAPFLPGTAPAEDKPGIVVSGPFLEHSSLARINREVAAALLNSPALDTCLEPVGYASLPVEKFSAGDRLAPALLQHPQHLELTVRHCWPPDFRRPTRGKLAVILPWEYGAAPRVWVRQIEQNVDELWVPSGFVRDVFVRSGVSAQRVQVIPNGFDPKVFTPEGPTQRPHGCRKFMFLFVGGAIRRKGLDVLLNAYKSAFDAGDDVTLVVSTGANPAYSHNSLNDMLAEFINHPRLPHLIVLAEQFEDQTLAALYRSSNAFVLPYRGEGFGMPNLEAMACGRPIITTAQGPSQEYCSAQTAYLVQAKETLVPEDPPPLGELAGDFTWFEPDVTELAQTMLHVYRNGAEAAQRGRAAAKAARQKFTWPRLSELYVDRVKKILKAKNGADTKDREPVAAGA